MKARLLAMILALCTAPGCETEADTGEPEVIETDECAEELEAYPVSWDSWGANFFATYCDSCHASGTLERYGAPESVTFDTLEEVRDQRERIEVRTLEEQDMPPTGGVLEDELFLLDIFLRCGL